MGGPILLALPSEECAASYIPEPLIPCVRTAVCCSVQIHTHIPMHAHMGVNYNNKCHLYSDNTLK